MSPEQGTLLSKVNYPDDLKKLSEEDLPVISEEIRQFIIDVLANNPGHLGASLGAIELAVAIHYVYHTPFDKVIWDVGHQAYAHKILTGRKDVFYTNRTYKGISGFPKMCESEYDAFGVGHSSTSLSAALGMAVASNLQNEKERKFVVVIGDGSITAGQAFEALNNASMYHPNMLVILNDNGIAIDKNVGAIKEYLVDIVTSRTYNRIKDKVWHLLGGGSKYGKNTRELVRQIGNAVKSTLLNRSNLFESMHFRYFGPVDGHDVIHLTKLLHDLKNIPGPKLLHCITVKGKGYSYAELEQTRFHSPGVFDKSTGKFIENPYKHKPVPRYQTVFGKTIIELAEQNDKIVGITPAMPTGCSLNLMMEKMPDRAFDVGIAEQHAVTFAAGLAAKGMIPFCNIYSTFMQRAYDQMIHDVALQKLHVVICLDRGGLVGEDGATHHGVFDLSYLRMVPNITVASPMNEVELRNMMYTAQLESCGPFAIRYPRGRGVISDWIQPFSKLEIGKGRLISEGTQAAIVSIGHVGNTVQEVIERLQEENISIAHYDIRFLKPIDEELLHEILKKFSYILTVEDGTIIGGLGSAVLEFCSDHGYQAVVMRLGVPDRFIEQGTIEELQKECGYDADGIYNAVKKVLENN